VGKTRLAVVIAGLSEMPSVFVDLTVVRDAGLVVPQIAAALRLNDGASLDAIVEYLGDRTMLLVLDNVEHVIGAAASIGELVAVTSGLVVLATSRERLRVDGEQVYQLEPLGIDGGSSGTSDAVALFTQTAAAVEAGFDLERHRASVEQICASVDGLPLAVELAAAQVRALPPDMLAARLTERLRSPSSARRDLPERHQTMDDMIEWSLRLITTDELLLFVRLGVFAGHPSLEMIEDVCRDELIPDPLDVLGRLVDRSLVRRTTTNGTDVRFGMLEVLRERAVRLLELSDEHHLLRTRHADHIADVLDDIEERRWTDLSSEWTELTTELLPDARAAFTWASTESWSIAARITAALGPFWHREGGQEEGRRWIAVVLPHISALTTRTGRGCFSSTGCLSGMSMT